MFTLRPDDHCHYVVFHSDWPNSITSMKVELNDDVLEWLISHNCEHEVKFVTKTDTDQYTTTLFDPVITITDPDLALLFKLTWL